MLGVGTLSSTADAASDPAAELLIEQQTFLDAEALNAGPAPERALRELVREVNENGLRIRVAVIGGAYDLGSVPELWRKPRRYARFLGIELSPQYRGRLLVVMPNGFGVHWEHHSTTRDDEALARLRIDRGGVGELSAAEDAVRALAKRAGVGLGAGTSPQHATSPARSRPAVAARSAATSDGEGGASPFLLGGAALALLIAATLWIVEMRRRRWLHVAVPAAAAVALIGGVITVLVLSRNDGSEAPARETATISPASGGDAGEAGTPYTWGANERPAPEFHLSTADGGPISLSDFRGRPMIVTFVDPTCRNFCPLEARVLDEFEEQLPAARRPPIVAVSVDVYADSPADLARDERHWHLVPQWHWALGGRSALESVWKRYYAEVSVETRTIAGVTGHDVSHSEIAYLLDGKGDERALFSWPFSAPNIERTLRSLRSSQRAIRS